MQLIVDEHSGAVTLEGATGADADRLVGNLLGPGASTNCARPSHSQQVEVPAAPLTTPPVRLVRVARLYHGAVSEGPGRRSVVQVQGCPIRCQGCYVPETHDPNAGTLADTQEIALLLTGMQGAPRDGVTILGGEPFAQPFAVHGLLVALRERQPDLNIGIYTGYLLEGLLSVGRIALHRRILRLVDWMIDGPFVKELAEGRPDMEWRGSWNQRYIEHPIEWSRHVAGPK